MCIKHVFPMSIYLHIYLWTQIIYSSTYCTVAGRCTKIAFESYLQNFSHLKLALPGVSKFQNAQSCAIKSRSAVARTNSQNNGLAISVRK